MLHTQSEEDSSTGRGVGRDFFQVLPENNREYSPGLFPQEVRKEIPTFGRKPSWGGFGVEGILRHSFYIKSRQDIPPRVGRTVLGRLKEGRLLPTLSSDSWGHYPGLPPRQFGRPLLLHFFQNKDGEGSLALSHNVEGFSEKTMGSFPI